MIIAVMSAGPYKERRDACRNTWVRDFPGDVLFFVGEGAAGDCIELPCPDDYPGLYIKQFQIIERLRHEDYVFFCDDDTYVVVDRLLRCGYEQHDYQGCAYRLGDQGKVMAYGGAGFFLSHRAMEEAVAIGLDHPDLTKTTCADETIGYMMDMAGIPLHGDPRFNFGRYNGQSKFCNLVPNKWNQYITTHYVPPYGMPVIYEHFHNGADLVQNAYWLSDDNIRGRFVEIRGKWFFQEVSIRGGEISPAIGPYDFAHEAEFDCFGHLGGLR